MSESIQYFVDGRNAWQIGVLGFFTRLRGIIPSFGVSLLTMGVPFWWPTILPKTISFPGWVVFIGTVTLAGIIGSFGLILHRKRSTRSLEIKAVLHRLSHQIRDEETKTYKRVSQTQGSTSHDDEDTNFYEYVDRICNHVRDFFIPQLIDTSIQCAIRLAVTTDPPAPTEYVYSTFGRSSGLNAKRAETSEDIPSNKGIPRFLSDKHCTGILIYNDLKKAYHQNTYQMTKNDETFADEIKTLMVAPLNAWDGKKLSMIGLLYVTSKNENTFKVKHIDAMRFASDLVADSIAFTVQQLKSGGRLPQISRRRT